MAMVHVLLFFVYSAGHSIFIHSTTTVRYVKSDSYMWLVVVHKEKDVGHEKVRGES